MNILTGDIGGTNTRLLFAQMNGTVCEHVHEASYLSHKYKDLVDVVHQFLSDFSIKVEIDAACFAVAGPIVNGSVSVTNLPWVLSEKQLKADLKTTHLKLINDFYAVAVGISELNENDYLVLQHGQNLTDSFHPDAAVIGAGTGLGAAHLVWMKDHYQAFTSESGHTGFAPENRLQSELLMWMQRQHSHVSLEMILSGKGLTTIYHFLREMKPFKESINVAAEMETKDPAEVITEYALAEKDELCQATLDCFIEIYGAAAGNVALNYYPVTDLYIAGGIAAKIKAKLMSPAFIQAFVDKGLLSSAMRKVNIKLITLEKVGLYGALATVKTTYL